MRTVLKLPLVFIISFIVIAIWTFFAASIVYAEDVTISWENPTASESCSDATGDYTVAGTRIWQLVAETDSPVEQVVLENQLPGEYQYKATSFTTDGIESRLTSGSLTKIVTSFKAVAGTQVLQPVSIDNAFWLLPVGTVSEDTECLTDQKINDHYVVPNDKVSWSAGVTPRPLVVAECG